MVHNTVSSSVTYLANIIYTPGNNKNRQTRNRRSKSINASANNTSKGSSNKTRNALNQVVIILAQYAPQLVIFTQLLKRAFWKKHCCRFYNVCLLKGELLIQGCATDHGLQQGRRRLPEPARMPEHPVLKAAPPVRMVRQAPVPHT